MTRKPHTATPVRTWAITPPVVVCACGRHLETADGSWQHVDTDPTLSEDVPGNPDYDDIYMESLEEMAR